MLPGGDPASPVGQALRDEELEALVDWARLYRTDLNEGEVAVLWRAWERVDREVDGITRTYGRMAEGESEVLRVTLVELQIMAEALRLVRQVMERVEADLH